MKKQISTAQTESNIQAVLHFLSETPDRLDGLSYGLMEPQLREPLGAGERSFLEALAHLLNSEARSSEAIYLALLADEPLFADVHSERQWGRLVRYDSMPFPELLAYFKFRRTILLSVLKPLSEEKWARCIREEGKQRRESVYWRARALALHELEHLEDLHGKLHS
jgi:hypothetical protein